jgi:hypothetical protein
MKKILMRMQDSFFSKRKYMNANAGKLKDKVITNKKVKSNDLNELEKIVRPGDPHAAHDMATFCIQGNNDIPDSDESA